MTQININQSIIEQLKLMLVEVESRNLLLQKENTELHEKLDQARSYKFINSKRSELIEQIETDMELYYQFD